MLHSGTHNHFASQPIPERERLEIRFAGTGDDRTNPERESHRRRGPDSLGDAEDLESGRTKIHGNVVQALPQLVDKTADAIAHSPFLLREILDSNLLPQIEGAMSDQGAADRANMREPFESQLSNPNRETSDALRSIVNQLLDNPHTAIILDQLFHERLRMYHENMARLGVDANMDELRRVVEAAKTDGVNIDQLFEREDDEGLIGLIKKFKLPNPFKRLVSGGSQATQRLVKKMSKELEEEAHEGGQMKAENMRMMLRDAVATVDNLTMLQKHDHGHDEQEREEFSTSTLDVLSDQMIALNGHIDAVLQSKSNILHEKYKQNKGQLQEAIDGTRHLGNAVCYKLTQDLDAIRIAGRITPEELPLKMRLADKEFSIPSAKDVQVMPDLDTPEFLSHAREKLAQLEDIEGRWRQPNFIMKYFEEAGREHNEADKNIRESGMALAEGSQSEKFRALLKTMGVEQMVDSVRGFGELIQKVVDGSASPDELKEYNVLLSQMTPRLQTMLRPVLEAAEDPDYLDLLLRKQSRLTSITSIPPASELEKRLEDVQGKLFPQGILSDALDHQVSSIMNIEGHLRAAIQSVRMKFSTRGGGDTGEPLEFKLDERLVKQGVAELMELEDVKKDLVDKDVTTWDVPTKEQFLEASGGVDALGFYDPAEDRICMNFERIEEEAAARHVSFDTLYDRTLLHENGHRISLYFTDQSALIPMRLRSVFNETVRDSDGNEKTVEHNGTNFTYTDLLKYVAVSFWGYQELPESANRVRRLRYERDLVDELMNQYASWVDDRRPTPKAGDEEGEKQHLLFQMVDGDIAGTEMASGPALDDEKRRLFAAGGGIADDDDDEPNQDIEIVDYNQKLREVKRGIEFASQFADSHPAYAGEIDSLIKQIQPSVDSIERDWVGGRNVSHRLKGAEDAIDILVDAIRSIDATDLDLSAEQTGQKAGFRAIFDHVNFMSLYDVYGMFKEGLEDLDRMWKRRGSMVKGQTMSGITSWIPDWVPYVGQLKHEANRRVHQSELDEIEQWKKALENADSYELIVMLRGSRHPDQVRAIIEKLTELGRMDWNDDHVWRTLNDLSRYKMPIDKCKRSDVLRDRWLQKLITDIWDDKDLWFKWRRGNDSNYKQNMDQFTTTTDQLSNTKNGLDGTLARILELYTKFKKTPEIMPEDVNPHLYEKVIIYAIENGKMSMEDKFFYLVKGIAEGLLSIDRLRVLGGQEGGILNQFPFIDYFDRKNNSLPEVIALANRLTESEPNQFKPGLKSTLFVHLILGREDTVKQRVKKGTSKLAEKIDHEDVHYFMTHLDQSSLDNLLDTWSGNRQKVTPEGFKNAYVGFSDKLKAFALLASMNGRGFRFSRADAADIAKSLTSYVLLDNLLTRNGYDKDSRPKLGATEIYSEVGPVSKPIVVGKYRDNMNNFIEELLNTDHVGAAMEGEWGDITNKANRALGSSDRNNTRIDSDNIINNTTNIPPDNPLEVSRKIHKSIPFFEQALQKSILNNQDQFMQFLASKAGTLLGDIGKGVERKDIGDARQALQAFQGT